jgi:hypothetical protein
MSWGMCVQHDPVLITNPTVTWAVNCKDPYIAIIILLEGKNRLVVQTLDYGGLSKENFPICLNEIAPTAAIVAYCNEFNIPKT